MSNLPAVGVFGATGLVGTKMLEVLDKRNFAHRELRAIASERSAGKRIRAAGKELTVQAVSKEAFEGLDIAIFSAGGGPSRQWAPVAAECGAAVIDNSSAWRMDPDVPLVVPEVNMEAAANRPKGIIANPNCSTIQLVVALKPIYDLVGIERVTVSTYQAISGAGVNAVNSFRAQLEELVSDKPVKNYELPGQLAGNLLMSWPVDKETGYHEEELKLVRETKKILGDESIRVSPTAVRVPVFNGHSESVTVDTRYPITAARVREHLATSPGIRVIDDFVGAGTYPAPVDADGVDEVLVGRIRDDVGGNKNCIQLWVVADNLLKGAALNAVQIAEKL